MGQLSFGLFVLSSALIACPAVAQQQTPTPTNACGDLADKFDVKQFKAGAASSSTAPEPGKALVFFIEKDLTAGVLATPSTQLGVDGQWVGGTHGDSYFYFSLDPGVHHLCAYTRFGGVGGRGLAFAHFTAQAGGVYYLAAKNTRLRGDELVDVALVLLDEDEGKYLSGGAQLVTSQLKK